MEHASQAELEAELLAEAAAERLVALAGAAAPGSDVAAEDGSPSPMPAAGPLPVMGVVAEPLAARGHSNNNGGSKRSSQSDSATPDGSPVIAAVHAEGAVSPAAVASLGPAGSEGTEREGGSSDVPSAGLPARDASGALPSQGAEGQGAAQGPAPRSFDDMIAHFRRIAEELAEVQVEAVQEAHAAEAAAAAAAARDGVSRSSSGEAQAGGVSRSSSLPLKCFTTTSSFSDVASSFLLGDSRWASYALGG